MGWELGLAMFCKSKANFLEFKLIRRLEKHDSWGSGSMEDPENYGSRKPTWNQVLYEVEVGLF